MDKYFVEEADGNRYILNRPDGSWMVLELEEVNAIESYRRHERWKNDLQNQIDWENEDGNLDFSGEIDRDEFVRLCMEDIDENCEIYGGEEYYSPDFEEIVFNIAEENDIWRG